MFDNARLFESISTARLEQWAVREGGQVCVRVDGGPSEVRLTPREWNQILEDYHAKVDASARGLRWSFILALPVAILLFIVILSIPPLKAAWYWLDENANFLSLLVALAVWSGLPLTAIVLHAGTVLRALDRAKAQLARHEPFAARHRVPGRQALPLEKLALLTILPWLFIQSFGTFDPDAYRNTPWTGIWLDLTSLVGVSVLIGFGFRRWRATRLAQAAAGPEKLARDVDVLARVRNTPS